MSSRGCIEKVLGLVARLNFGLKQFYNIVILGSVAHITKAEQRIRENYRGENEIGFYAWNTTAGSNNKSGNKISIFIQLLLAIRIIGKR